MALWMDPGGEEKAHSCVGGVVGGVMRSMEVGELAALLSSGASSLSPDSLAEELDWVLTSFLRLMLMLKWGRKEVLGERLVSFFAE